MTAGKMLAEGIGTFALVFVGMLAIVNGVGLLGVAFAHGLAIAVMATALGTVSGGQFNPAVSLGLSLVGKQSWADTLRFAAAQLIGGALGAFAVLGLTSRSALNRAGFGQPNPAEGVPALSALGMEAVLTFFLVLVVLKVAVRQGHALGGLIVGLTIVADILAGGPVSGAAMNPARVFGPAVVSGDWTFQWVYWAGPLLGAALAAGTARALWRLPTQIAASEVRPS
ncbi:MIP/aquaporin family protein [Deinococcus sp. QL22]|uniref:MIP/aquaporin family protein n=1 Tax=Deinococcus sp. QL22 TaxID=2939437 RepID=UPI0020170EDD|nr:aquaporin [Deinococcus sp. QL22]UQN08184.1 aquaporin [Deinococcus sp. QL22]